MGKSEYNYYSCVTLCYANMGLVLVTSAAATRQMKTGRLKRAAAKGIVTGIFQYLVSCAVFYRFFCDTDFLFNHTR